MSANEKRQLTDVGKLDYFNNTFKKLMCENILSEKEKEFILEIAICFIKEYEKDQNKKSFFELAYYIILKYSTTYNDYEPLFDFSFNYGFYPTVDFINNKYIVNNKTIDSIAKEFIINKFKEDDLTFTLHQKEARQQILKSNSNEVCYVAPTSFGKSSIIIDLIKLNLNAKHAIIVPTKSLLAQTYKKLKQQNLNVKLLSHDEMYLDDNAFIAVFTQERAIRLLENVEWGYDYLFIDEAHNLFERDMRNILLSRLISLNKLRKPNSKIVYLSPLIEEAQNLKIIKDNEKIKQFKIDNNIKVPELYYYDQSSKLVNKYNKYFNKNYPINSFNSLYSYILNTASNKNLIYFYRPKKVESFAGEFFDKLPKIKINKEIKETIKILKKYVHKDFNIVSFLTKGIIYLHGKLPEYIKDYLEFKFNKIEGIKYLIGNSVILEGVNMPISSLYILDPYKLTYNKTVNLIGRVNRLSEIFDNEKGDLKKLLPQIHFIKSQYCALDTNINNYLEKLRDTSVLDELKNPILINYETPTIKDPETLAKRQEKDNQIISIENEYFKKPRNKKDMLKHSLISHGMQEFYELNDKLVDLLMKKINYYSTHQKSNAIIRIFNTFFSKDNTFLIDFELGRLKENKARDYYRRFIDYTKTKSLKWNIQSTLRNFNIQIKKGKIFQYIGKSYGEVDENGYKSYNNSKNVYVNIAKMSNMERTNIAIIKLKMEEDFISFKFNKIVEISLEFGIISQDEYNKLIYGMISEEQLKLVKQGVPVNLINKMSKDDQLKNINFNHLNIPIGNFDLKEYYNKQDDFYKFQIDKFISFLD